jgi:hypothetical protein
MKSRWTVKRPLATLMFLALSLTFVSCATTSSTIPFHEVPPNEQGNAVIYVYRLRSMVGASVKWAVRLDGKIVANLNQGAYVALCAAPGAHTITIGDSTVFFGGGAVNGALNGASQSGEAQAKDNGTFVAAANGVYFLRSKGFDVNLLSKGDAMNDIVEMMYDPGM